MSLQFVFGPSGGGKSYYLYEKIIEGYRLCELALKYQRAERELRLSMSSVLRKLRKSRELRGMYSKKTHRS